MSTLKALEKSRIALHYTLIGKGFYECVKILHYAESLHTGMRKDLVTPEFAHQIWIANFITTLALPDDTMRLAVAIALLHDTSEDKFIGFEEIESLFGKDIAHGVQLMTKKFRGMEYPKESYFTGLASMAAAAIVKGVDRLHNLSSMRGVFKTEKKWAYIDETEEWHLPMLKVARHRYPEYNQAFENIKFAITLLIDSIKHTLPPKPEPIEG